MGQFPKGKIEEIQQQCAQRGIAFEWAFALDALQTERNQGITMDSTQLWLSTPQRRYALIDAPGHREFLHNMMTGATRAEAALLVIDAEAGMHGQSRQHAYFLQLLGIKHIIIVINKMDAVGYSAERFAALEEDICSYFHSLTLTPAAIVPVAARSQEGLVTRSTHMPWYNGPSVLGALEALPLPSSAEALPLRFPVQAVYKFDNQRIVAGRIESGSLKVGDQLYFSPSDTHAHVTSLMLWPQSLKTAHAGQSVGVTLHEPIFVERGMVGSHITQKPLLSNHFRARIFWLGAAPLQKEKRYTLRFNTLEIAAELRSIDTAIHPHTLEHLQEATVACGMAAEVVWRARGLVPLDDFTIAAHTGRFVIFDGYTACGGGMIDLTGAEDQRGDSVFIKSSHITPQSQTISIEQRARAHGHLPAVLWFSGLSGSGKSTLAQALQRALFAKGYQVFVLDGDNLRGRLSRDLGFSPEDRSENIRRAAEVAALFADAGFIVISSLISPTEADRLMAASCAPEWFHSIYIKADLRTCEARDVKGLYALARSGEIKQFTGISAPYDPPHNPDLVIDTETHNVEACLGELVRYVEHVCVAPLRVKDLA